MGGLFLAGLMLAANATAAAAPPAPTGAHPRLFLDPDTLAAMKAQAAVKGSATQKAIARCDVLISSAKELADGGYQGHGFAESLASCLVAWEVRGDAASEQVAVKVFNALLDDLATLGDGAGGDDVVRHDTGYSMRTYAPYAAIAYDWLHDAPGVDDNLRAHARERFQAWTSWYDTMGYHNHEPGANYHAGYVFADSMIAIAEGGEAGTDGDTLWAHVVDDIFGKDMAAGMAAGGVLDGGDWLEGWQYAPLSVAEYALSARAVRANGATLDGFAAWEGSLAVRAIYALTPDKSAGYIGGDSETETPNVPMGALTAWAVLLDVAPDDARAWAGQLVKDQQLSDDTFPLFGVLAELRMPAAPKPFATDASTWYYPKGSRTLYARSNWSASAVWMVSQCAPRLIDDHMFNDAGNVVLTRGSDNLIVDPSPYGSFSSLTGNAPTVASTLFPANYIPGQGDWGLPANTDFRWARQTQSAVVAARCDYAGQYQFQDTKSDIPRAMRDLVLVPYGDGNDAVLVLVDDIQGAAADRPMLTRLHSMAPFTAETGAWRATVGASDMVVQVPYATAGTPTTDTPATGTCDSAPKGACTITRFTSPELALSVPSAHAQAITVVDAVAKGVDPGAAATNTGDGWRTVEMDRSTHIAVVVVDPGKTTVTYTAAPGKHVIVGAPAGATGRADVTSVANGSACDVTVAAHTGDGGVDARPVVLRVGTDCVATEDPSQNGFTPPDGKDPPPGSNGGGNGDLQGGCCQAGRAGDAAAPMILVALAFAWRRRRARA